MRLNGKILASLYNAHVSRDEDGFRVFAPEAETEEALVGVLLGIVRTYDASVSRRFDKFDKDDEKALDELKRIIQSSRQRQRRAKAKRKFASEESEIRAARIEEIKASTEFTSMVEERVEEIKEAKTRRGRAKKPNEKSIVKKILVPELVAEAVLDDEIERELVPTFYVERTPRAELDAFDAIFDVCESAVEAVES